jgi:toxin-antitoxin system PIN domain toxin
LIAVDTNILVYSHRGDSAFHDAALAAINRLVDGTAVWAIPWPCIHEFLAVVTNPRLHKHPTPRDMALRAADEWLQRANLVILNENDGYWPLLRSIVAESQVIGPRVHDARIAAICLQHGVSELWSADRDFTRFPRLKVVNPLVA